MKVFVTGSSGFIGQHLITALLANGHQVTACVHHKKLRTNHANLHTIQVDFNTDHQAALWQARVRGMDVVINTVGIIRQSEDTSFDTLHSRVPIALFTACQQAGVSRVIQLSALGADDHAQTAYHRSKKVADDFLRSLSLQWAIVQPSLVYGDDGISATMFRQWAALPIHLLPADGKQMVQPVLLDDLLDLLCHLVNAQTWQSQSIIAAGPEAISIKTYLQTLRQGLGYHRRAWCLPIPAIIMRGLARLGDTFPHSPLCSDTWAMLQRGNHGDHHLFETMLGRSLHRAESFIPKEKKAIFRCQLLSQWLLPLAAYSLAFLWIYSGVVSLFSYQSSLALLSDVGLSGNYATLSLWFAVLLDVTLGVMIIINRRLPYLWHAQIAVVLIYSVIIVLFIPSLLLHPFTPVVKNIPLLALMALIAVWEDK
jgi:uncharacterized protein YbjT (DUF2867 family)